MKLVLGPIWKLPPNPEVEVHRSPQNENADRTDDEEVRSSRLRLSSNGRAPMIRSRSRQLKRAAPSPERLRKSISIVRYLPVMDIRRPRHRCSSYRPSNETKTDDCAGLLSRYRSAVTEGLRLSRESKYNSGNERTWTTPKTNSMTTTP